MYQAGGLCGSPLINGDRSPNIVLEDHGERIALIMKGGRIYKDTRFRALASPRRQREPAHTTRDIRSVAVNLIERRNAAWWRTKVVGIRPLIDTRTRCPARTEKGNGDESMITSAALPGPWARRRDERTSGTGQASDTVEASSDSFVNEPQRTFGDIADATIGIDVLIHEHVAIGLTRAQGVT